MSEKIHTHMLTSQGLPLYMVCYFLILCQILPYAQSQPIYEDLMSGFNDKWFSYLNTNCENHFFKADCNEYKFLLITQCYTYEYHHLIFQTLELKPHYELTLKLTFLMKPSPGSKFIVYIDGREHQKTYNNSLNSNFFCNYTSSNYILFPISITIQHSSSSVTIAMTAQKGDWGISQFQISIKECSIECDSCNSNGCFNSEMLLRSFNSQIFSVISTEEGWQSQGGKITEIKECFGFNYIASNGDHFFKVFDLDQHYAISFQLKLLIFNSNSTQINIYVDEVLVNTINFVYEELIFSYKDLCDRISMEEVNLLQYQHLKTQLKIKIKVDLIKIKDGINAYIGMRDFQLFQRKRSFDDGCFDQNIDPFDGCFSNTYDCIQGCGNCIKGICYNCVAGWEFIQQETICIPNCGDAIITYYEECDDGNLIPYDGCHECKYSCPQHCRRCEFGKCLECENQYSLLQGNCLQICSDYRDNNLESNIGCYNFLKSEGYQQHFILNNINPEGSILDCNELSYGVFGYQYHQCYFKQIYNCIFQQYGKCLVCQPGYELNFYKNQCIPKCQDEIIQYEEICNDGSRIQLDGCLECQKSCQIECLFCQNDKCYLCLDGWQLQENLCRQICGDGQLAILSNEQCDDVEDPYCSNCQYECDSGCAICNKFQNCEVCKYPLININGKCVSVCGDNIVTPFVEQCDDGNDIPYDGCYQCEYQCSFGCLDELEVNESKYISCGQNYAIINNECINLCGDGILDSNFEQCDDGNNNGGDGCSYLCIEEYSYRCINQDNQLSYCTFIQQPNFNLVLLSDRQNQTKILDLSFSQEVYLQSGLLLEQVVDFSIIPETEFKLSVLPIQNITSKLGNPDYQITIHFDSPVTYPILQIAIQKYSILNQYDLDLYTNQKEIPLGTPFVLSEPTQKRINQVMQMNDGIVFSTASIAGILFFTGNYIVFFNLLDLLQTLSYIRYMQYKFPPHLRQFLDAYTKISLKPILDSLKIDELIAQINGGTLPNSQNKSTQTNNLDQCYLINAKGCFLSYIISAVTYILFCLISSNKMSAWLRQIEKKHEENVKILSFILKLQKIQIKFQKLKVNYFTLGVFQLFYSTLHQLLFSTLLQFPNYSFDSPFGIVNSIAAFSSLILLIHIFCNQLSITTAQIKDKQKWKYYFEENKNQFWADNYKPFQIYRIAIYITIITKLIRYPEAQSVLLSMQAMLYLIYLIRFKPMKSNFELAKLICRELTLLINTGSFLLYSFELNDTQQLFYGWLHISLFCSLMGFTLFVDIFEQVQNAYYLYLKKIQAQEKTNTQSNHSNSAKDLDMKK
ncbi:unnamed protein product [Paramecium octaurelia]|uniref:Uncharacterized protein n=1 Tax=Paramecium octaurelia TaxID=43137 RepID=A0A8S1WG05_PAROT|nr:unnamed protein product [Paramecium octaurelia]